MNSVEKNELDLILASPGFFRAPKLQQALNFLCQWHWSDQTDAPTQYDLSQELYGDGVESEINVRNLIMRLRTKLNEYYGNSSNGNGVRLEIPLGEYRVVFRPLENGAAGGSTASPHEKTAVQQSSSLPGDSGPDHDKPLPEPARQAVTDNPYAMAGVEADIEYIVVGDDGGGSKADPSMESWFFRRLFGSPSRLMKMLLYLAAAVVVVLLIGSRFRPQSVAAKYVEVNGCSFIGHVDSATKAWEVSLGAPIRGYKELTTPTAGEVRYLVAFGGRERPDDTVPWVRPQAVIISATGRQMMKKPIDLLERFNPFEGQYDDTRFEFDIRQPVDLDVDGFSDGILHLYHQFFPDIIYFISGQDRECTGGFANSGRCEIFKPGPEGSADERGGNGRPYGVLGRNNRMGHQEVFFLAAFNRFLVSPDILDPGIAKHATRYRPIGDVGVSGSSLSVSPDGLFRIDCADEGLIEFNTVASRSTDPWFGGFFIGAAQKQWFDDLYELVRDAERLVRDKQLEDGQAMFRSVLDEAIELRMESDVPLIYYIKTKAATALKQAGRADLALEWLPDDPTEILNPGAVAFSKGELMLLLRQPGATAQFAGAFDNHDGNGRYEQFVYARILEGASGPDIHRDLRIRFNDYLKNRVSRDWLLIPGLLCEEVSAEREALDGLIYPEAGETLVTEHQVFPQQHACWSALTDLELGIVPSDWPDDDIELVAPIEQEEMVDARRELLEAVDMYKRVNEDQGLILLAESYSRLNELSHREPRAIIPFTYAAYTYGFAALKAGDTAAGASALEEAYGWYPWGGKAERARSRLAPMGIDLPEPPPRVVE